MAENKRVNIHLMNINQEKYRTSVKPKGENIENTDCYIMAEYMTILTLHAYNILHISQ